jgi:hypothetical protein
LFFIGRPEGKRRRASGRSRLGGRRLYAAHNSAVGSEHILVVEAALATARKQVYDLSVSPSPTFDNAGSLETGEYGGPRAELGQAPDLSSARC